MITSTYLWISPYRGFNNHFCLYGICSLAWPYRTWVMERLCFECSASLTVIFWHFPVCFLTIKLPADGCWLANGTVWQVGWMAGVKEGGECAVSRPGQQRKNHHNQQTQAFQCKSSINSYIYALGMFSIDYISVLLFSLLVYV